MMMKDCQIWYYHHLIKKTGFLTSKVRMGPNFNTSVNNIGYTPFNKEDCKKETS